MFSYWSFITFSSFAGPLGPEDEPLGAKRDKVFQRWRKAV